MGFLERGKEVKEKEMREMGAWCDDVMMEARRKEKRKQENKKIKKKPLL
jgi:hypothetical protein